MVQGVLDTDIVVNLVQLAGLPDVAYGDGAKLEPDVLT